MPMRLPTVEELIATQFKRTGYYFVFNCAYNDVHSFKTSSDMFSYLDPETTDEAARDEFIQFMQDHFPEVELHEVFDFVSLGWESWPYLGSIAFDIEQDSPVYNALVEKYERPEGGPRSRNAVFWELPYDVAKQKHDARVERRRLNASGDDYSE